MKKHIPNMLTCCNLISGCIATVAALQGAFPLALLLIVVGAVFDFFDGMSARLLHVSSPIGKELDSLADVVTFGVAPSAMLSAFIGGTFFAELPSLNWIAKADAPHVLYIVLTYLPFVMAAFSALRLAKFNLDERQTMGFIGLPTPANALFWGALIAGPAEKFYTLAWAPNYVYVMLGLMLVSCYLLVSEIPMFALKFKHWGWKGNEVKYLFLLSSLLLIVFFGIAGIAAVIAWYVVLSLCTQKRR